MRCLLKCPAGGMLPLNRAPGRRRSQRSAFGAFLGCVSFWATTTRSFDKVSKRFSRLGRLAGGR